MLRLSINSYKYTRFFCRNARNIVSEAFKCKDDWKARLDCNVLKSFNTNEFLIKIKNISDEKGLISSLDMDILMNKLPELDFSSLDLLGNILYNFRHSSEAVNCIESTNHAIIRTLLDFKDYETLFKFLNDKVNYGVFLDHFTSILLLDTLLEECMINEAVQIVGDLMLQEEINEPLLSSLCLLTCHKWLEKQLPEIKLEEPPKFEQNLEVIYRRISFIQNPYFDDHFDLFNDQLKIGKALTMLTSSSEDNILRGYYLIGLVLFQKFEKALSLLDELSKSSSTQVILDLHLDSIENLLNSLEPRENLKKSPGATRLIDIIPVFSQKKKDEYLSKFKEIKKSLVHQKKLASNLNVDEHLKNLVSKDLKKYESRISENQKTKYCEWTKQRSEKMNEQLEKLEVSNKKFNLAKRLASLKEREEKLRYFEQKALIDLEIVKNPEPEQIEDVIVEEQFVAPPGERKSKDMKKKKK